MISMAMISMAMISLPVMIRYGYDMRYATGVLAASIFHFGEHTIAEAKAAMTAAGVQVRPA